MIRKKVLSKAIETDLFLTALNIARMYKYPKIVMYSTFVISDKTTNTLAKAT